jgi:hypothetical protein
VWVEAASTAAWPDLARQQRAARRLRVAGGGLGEGKGSKVAPQVQPAALFPGAPGTAARMQCCRGNQAASALRCAAYPGTIHVL